MDEELEGRLLYFCSNGVDLLQRQFARQHHLRNSRILQKARLGRCADIGLRTGMQLNGRHVDFEQAHVLDDECIHTRVIQLPGHTPRRLQLIVAQDGVERDEDARVKAMRVAYKPRDVCNGVGGFVACAHVGPTDIHRIGAMIDRLDAYLGITCGREQFKVGTRHELAPVWEAHVSSSPHGTSLAITHSPQYSRRGTGLRS